MASANAPGAGERDAVAYVAFLDAQKQVNKAKKIGTKGYCMGGPLVVKTAATIPNRIGTGASFHGGNLVTDKPESPHLLASKIKARMYFGVASNDDSRQPDAKEQLREAFAAAKVQAEIEVYAGALHGWCVPDMPAERNAPIYNKPDAERAWASGSRCTRLRSRRRAQFRLAGLRAASFVRASSRCDCSSAERGRRVAMPVNSVSSSRSSASARSLWPWAK